MRNFLSDQGDDLAASPIVNSILSKPNIFKNAACALSIPVLLVRAGQQGAVSNTEVRRFRELCPQLQVAHVDTAGHLIARDAPIALADLILEFFQSDRVRDSLALTPQSQINFC